MGHWADSSYLTLAHNYNKVGVKDEKKNLLSEYIDRFKDSDKNAGGFKWPEGYFKRTYDISTQIYQKNTRSSNNCDN